MRGAIRWIILVSLILPALAVRADDRVNGPELPQSEPIEVRHDHSRFTDGPRNVPAPRGAAMERAAKLGLGTRQAAAFLMRHRPRESWMAAIRSNETPSALTWPVDEGRFGRGFGFTRRRRPELRHNGVDIVAPSGSIVRAVADGIVAYSDNGIRGFGNCVVIVHRDGLVSLYGHNQRTTVQPGWRVTRGERIALVGSTGISHGPHVHFELRRDGRLVDPMPLFRTARREPAEVEENEEDEREATSSAPVATHEPDTTLGTAAMAERILRAGADEALRERAGTRVFRNVLWPTRGGTVASHDGRRGRATIATAAGEAVRAAADGLVVYAGDALDGDGREVVLVHRNGWITRYREIGETAVRAGDVVERGSWIGRTGTRPLRFELRDGTAPHDPVPLFVQRP